MSLDRRNFLKGAVVAAGTAVASGALVGCSAGQPKAKTEADLPETGSASTEGGVFTTWDQEMTEAGYASWTREGAVDASNTDPIPPVEPPEKWDYETDAVVVGTGGGGVNAAFRLAHLGKTVTVLEKSSEIGGCTKESNIIITWGSDVQTAAGLPTTEQMEEKILTGFIGQSPCIDETKIRALLYGGADSVNWLGEMGVPWEVDPWALARGDVQGVCWQGEQEGDFVPRATKKIIDFCHDEAEKLGANFLMSTKAVALVKDGDRVVGVKAETSDGNAIFVKGTLGVLLAGGGFGSNRDMLARYAPSALQCGCSTAGTNDTGEVIRMGWGAGADIAGNDSFYALDGGYDHGEWVHYLYAGDIQIARQPWLGIDRTGRRYRYYDTRKLYKAITLQPQVQNGLPGHRGHVFFDSKYEEVAPTFEQETCRRLIHPDMPNIDRLPEALGYHDWKEAVREAIDNGTIPSGNSIEELAGKMDLQPDIVKKAVDDWNAMCDAGVDPEQDFPAEYLIKIDQPPYYGISVSGILMSTFCGLLTDNEMRVIDTDGKVIPGLFAAGCTGAYYGNSGYCAQSAVIGGANLSFATGFMAANTMCA